MKNASDWLYGSQYLPTLLGTPTGDEAYGFNASSLTPQGRPDYLQNRATTDRFDSDAIMRQRGITSLPRGEYDWVMGLGNLSQDRLQELMSQGIIHRGVAPGEGEDPFLSLDWSKLPTIMGMQANDFVRYDPDSTRVRNQGMVLNDPNYGLVTLGANVIQPRDTGLAGILPMVASMVAGQFAPGIGLARMVMERESARSNQGVYQGQIDRFRQAMQNQQQQRNPQGSVQNRMPLMALLSAMRRKPNG